MRWIEMCVRHTEHWTCMWQSLNVQLQCGPPRWQTECSMFPGSMLFFLTLTLLLHFDWWIFSFFFSLSLYNSIYINYSVYCINNYNFFLFIFLFIIHKHSWLLLMVYNHNHSWPMKCVIDWFHLIWSDLITSSQVILLIHICSHFPIIIQCGIHWNLFNFIRFCSNGLIGLWESMLQLIQFPRVILTQSVLLCQWNVSTCKNWKYRHFFYKQ